MVFTTSIPQSILAPEDMGDKTLPYIQEDYPSLQDMVDPHSPPPSSRIVRVNSFFCQSLIREMSGNSLDLPYKDNTDEKELVSSGYHSPLLKKQVSEIQKPSAIENDFVVQLKKRLSAIFTEAALNEYSGVMQEPVELNPTTEMRPNESPKVETLKPLLVNLTANESSRKRPRTPSPEEETGEPTEKSLRISAIDPEHESLTKEGQRTSSINQNISESQVKESEIVLQAKEFDNKLEIQSGISGSEENLKIHERATEQESNEEPEITSLGTPPGRGRRCSVCYHIDCPRVLRLKAQEDTTINTSAAEEKPDEPEAALQNVILQQTPVTPPGIGRCSDCNHIDCPRVLRLKAQEKIPKIKSQSRKHTSITTPIRRSIGTRNLLSGWTKRISNHSPLHIRTLKTRLFKAVENGDLVQVQRLMQDTGPTVRKGKSGCTLLHIAVFHEQVDVVMFLLKWISPNITNILGQTPGHVAAERGHIQLLRILLKDQDFDPDRKDKRHNTMKSLLSAHLFEAVLEGDKRQIERLLSVGADPDSHGGNRVKRMLERELLVSTPRHLAQALNMDSVLTMFKKKASDAKNIPADYSHKPTKEDMVNLRIPLRQFNVIPSISCKGAPDVYKMDKNTRGFVYFFNFSSFENRSDLNLPQVDYDGRLLSSVFGKMGYKCETHSSLTARQTKEVLKNLRDDEALSEAGCVVFVISGYGLKDKHFLTSDMKSVSVDYLRSLFRDSDCPQLKNKPKLFLFNLYNTNEVNMNSVSERGSPKSVRFEEPLSDMACISLSSFDLECMSNGKGSVFSWALCRTLADHAHNKELGDLYREFLKQCSTTSMSVTPELRFFGFTKKFFFNPQINSVN